MRKNRLFISGMVGSWLWLAGLPVSHDTAGQWLAGQLPRAHAYDIVGTEISGIVDADTTLNSDLTVNPSLTVNPGVKLTLAVGTSLQPPFPDTATFTNNGTVETYNNTVSVLNVLNNGSFSVLGNYTTANATFTNTGTVTVGTSGGSTAASFNPRHLENTGIITNNYLLKVGTGGTISNNNSGGVIINNSSMIIQGSFNNSSLGRIINGQTVYGLTNYGTLDFDAGTLSNSGTIMNAAGGTFTSARIFNNEVGGRLINNGTMISSNINNLKEITNRGTIDNSGTFTTMSGTTLDNYGTITSYAGATITNQGTFTNYAGATITSYGTFTTTVGLFTNNGTMANYGTFNGDVTNNGTFTNAGTINQAITNNNILTNSGTINFVQNGVEAWGFGPFQPTTAELTNSGTISGFNSFGKLTNTAAGVINVTGGGAILYSGELVNNGRIINNATFQSTYDQSTGDPGRPLRAATLTNNSSFTNSAGATFENKAGATFSNNGTLYNYGSFANMAGSVQNVPTPGIMTNTGAIYNYGALTNQDGSTFTSSGAIYNYGTFTNAAGSTLAVTGGTVYGPIVNNGTFNVSGGSFTLPSAGQTLSITNLSGNAAFRVAAVTAAGAPVTVTTSAVGSHTLTVGGSGSASGTVKAVDLPAGSTASFSGGGDAGAYYYTLARGSALGLDTEDYYFASTGQPSTLSKTAMDMAAGPSVVWYGEMNEIRKRMGELRIGTQSSDDFWVRGYASKFNVRPAGSDGYHQIMRGMELGKDNPQSFNGGKKFTGFLLGHGGADNTYAGGGSGTTNSNYLGAYASWLRDDGAYFDLIGKYNWFSHHFATASDSGSYDNKGLGLSAEIGRRFERKNGVFIEPAAELSSFWSEQASYTTANGLAVEVPSSRSLQLRLGVTAGRKWQDAGGTSRQFYGKVAWVNEFDGDSSTRVDNAAFDTSLRGHQWVTGIGFIQDTANYQLYFDAEKSWGSTVSKDWGLNAGCRFKF